MPGCPLQYCPQQNIPSLIPAPPPEATQTTDTAVGDRRSQSNPQPKVSVSYHAHPAHFESQTLNPRLLFPPVERDIKVGIAAPTSSLLLLSCLLPSLHSTNLSLLLPCSQPRHGSPVSLEDDPGPSPQPLRPCQHLQPPVPP